LLLAAAGAGLASALALAAEYMKGSPLEGELLAVLPHPDWADARNQCLVVAGLLLVPASVFPAVVGSMFPTYWRATPQTVVARNPVDTILDWLALLLTYALVALVLPATGLLVVPLIAAVFVVALKALRAVAFSLLILDPIRFAQRLRDLCLRNQSLMLEAHGDLCRFIRGLREEKRRSAVAQCIGLLESVWKERKAELERLKEDDPRQQVT
jgi:hypothetical protein